jgi:O-antigen/teichoic acid export membrane protein
MSVLATQSDSATSVSSAEGKSESLRGIVLWSLAGNLVYAGAQWGMLTLLTWLGTPAQVGEFSLAFAVTTPIILLTNMDTRRIQATDTRREHPFRDYLVLRIVSSIVALAVISGVAMWNQYSSGTLLVIGVVALAKMFESLSDIYHGLFQSYERMDRIAQSLIAKGVLSLVAVAGVFWWTHDVAATCLALAVVWGLMFFVDIVLSRVLWFRIHDARPTAFGWWKLAGLSWSMGVTTFLVSFNTNLPRYFLSPTNDMDMSTQELWKADLGVFSALAYLILMGTIVINAVGQGVTPRLARLYAAGDRHSLRLLLMKLFGFAGVIGAVGIFVAWTAGEPILRLVYGSKYAERADVFVWVMSGAALSFFTSFLSYAMTAFRYFRVQVPVLVMVTASTWLACAVLVPTHRALGAAYAVALGYGVYTTLGFAVLAHGLHNQPQREGAKTP